MKELENVRDTIRQELEIQKSQLYCQIESNEKLLAELNECRQQFDQMCKQLDQLTEDNQILKSSLSSKDDELIRLTEKLTELEKSTVNQRQSEMDAAEIEKLTMELNRLRQHLVQVEENYIGYLKEAEEHVEKLQKTIQQYEHMNLDQREAEHEELVQLLRKELEQSREQLHQCEDKNERLATNLINMQSVIEQLENGENFINNKKIYKNNLLINFFSLLKTKKEHERKIRSMNDEYQKQKLISEQRDDEWRCRLKTCEQHLFETRQALEAASRLTEQIEQKELMIEQLKREGKRHLFFCFVKKLKKPSSVGVLYIGTE